MGNHHSALGFLFAAALALAAPAAAERPADNQPLDEIVVTATLRSVALEELPGSASVLTGTMLRDAGQEHFEDVLPLVPNLNWAGDTSRPRYFQIRGIGELQQYQGAPNPSVGFLIDDIDFSGLGSAATLFDVDHIEVLRGPQGILYGANALAGLIYVKSADPAETFGGRAEFDAGDHNEHSYGAVLTGPVSSLDSAFRLAVQRYTSDGFYHNAYLGRSNTDNRDELTLRGKWRYEPNDQWRVDLTLLRAQIDNGYDAFAIDNSRTTQSDHPSVDRQYSTGLSARSTYSGLGSATFTTIATYADTKVNYGFDGDWGNPNLWAPYTYDFTEYQVRYRSTRSLEFRLGDTATRGAQRGLSWLVGIYAFELRESLTDTMAGTYLDPFDATQDSESFSVSSSEYRSRNAAVYGQLDGDIGAARWSVGLRGERHISRYSDTTTNLDAPTTANNFRPADNLWGGQASIDLPIAAGQHVYALVARGYKASGFNLIAGLPVSQLQFGPESDLNLEVGHKAQLAEGRLQIDTSLFYMVRHNEQLLTGEQLDPSNPDTFILFTGNAKSGFNYGLESTVNWAATASLVLGGSLGLLQTRYRGFVQNDVTLPDRALPHAAPWQAALNATWRDPRGPYARLDVTGMGPFFYDLPPNDTRSSAYGLVNGKLGWESARWEAYLWGRNLLDKNYTVRGFYFGNEPPDFPTKLYTQLGEPRNWGVHLTVRF
ncbi:MAG TPA: TonB-dependent receptor plug domain-containing protein [Steroidobacteraceae bacterium]|nr:TonB-dependent receptor plug domain-containing protein [Steroidobacteraceae bacterium]